MYKNPMFLFFCGVCLGGARQEHHGRMYQSRHIFQRLNQHKNNSFCRYFLKICPMTDSDHAMLHFIYFKHSIPLKNHDSIKLPNPYFTKST